VIEVVMVLSEASGPAMAAWLAQATGATEATVRHIERLGGGAIQENWAVDIVCHGGQLDGEHRLVLRTDAPSRVAVSWDRSQEFRILEVAYRAGVTAPEPIALCTDSAVLGQPFYLMRRVAGEARGFKLVRDPAVLARGEQLVARLGAELARLHRVAPPVAGLEFIPVPQGAAGLARVAEYRGHLDMMGSAECVLEWALAWLERHAPAPVPPRLIHADFRTGNYLVEAGELAAVLDWEFAGFGDPLEDLGWMLGKYWRFGAYRREAGGIGSREALLAGYEAEAGHGIDRAAVPYWEVLGTVRWAVIALMQASRHFAGAEASLELALTAHVLPVLELDLLTRVREIEETGR
jgi:aminoglycoside phosphotransferase (APT) family kinase protein